MNRVIKLLLISDMFLVTGFGLIDPVLAIYINDRLVGGSLFAVGLASAIYFFTKSIIELPFSRYVDSHDRSKFWLVLGTICTAAVPFVYVFATRIEHIYLAQVLYGIGSGLAFPTWLGLWSTHLDRHHESYEWSLYQTLAGVGAGGAAAIGSALAEWVGFQATFIIVGVFSVASSLVLLFLQNDRTRRSPTKVPNGRNHKIKNLFR
jgi:DHA1 family quinolone resistance protein-like MFS transporter